MGAMSAMGKDRANAANALIAPENVRVRTVGDVLRASAGYLDSKRRSQQSCDSGPATYVVIERITPYGDHVMYLQEQGRYEQQLEWLSRAVRIGNKKKHGKEHLARQIAAAERRLRNSCVERDCHLIYTLTLKDAKVTDAELNRIRSAFTSSLTRNQSSDLHPWVAVPEHGKSGRYHIHLILSRFCDRARLTKLWRAAAGERAGHIKFPSVKDAGGYVPLRAANYLIKEFRRLHGQGKRAQCVFASRRRAGERKASERVVRTLEADSFEEALAALLRQSAGPDLARFVGNEKRRCAHVVLRTGHSARVSESKDAHANYVGLVRRVRS